MGAPALISKGFPVTTLPDWYNWIGAGQLFGVFPVRRSGLLIVFAVTYVIMNLTRFGREVYAVGGNPEAARLSGIHVSFVKITIMVVVQILAAFSGIIPLSPGHVPDLPLSVAATKWTSFRPL